MVIDQNGINTVQSVAGLINMEWSQGFSKRRERLIGFKKLIYTTMETEKSRPGKAKSEDRRRPKSSLKTMRQRENIRSYSTQPH